MALTSRDETDLLLPMLDGAAETPPFGTFLERLRRRAGAVSISVAMRPDGGDPIDLFIGPNLRRMAHDLGLQELNLTDRIHYDRLRPGRVYSADEFDDHDPVRKAQRARDMRKLGLVDERVVRLLHEDGLSAWLILAADRPCTAADGALLSSVAPYLAAALRSFVAGERQRLADARNAESLQRAGVGWMVFDKSARLIALAPLTRDVLTTAFGHAPQNGQRLRELGPANDRMLADAAAAFTQEPEAPARTAVLLREPRIEAILSPAPPGASTALDAPALIATCRHGRAPAASRADHLARLFELPRREAELALLLSDGHSLAQAAAMMGLTIETARNYSKRLFAKLDVRGQAELVHTVYESCAMLA